MDPRLLDLVWEVYKRSGAKDYIHIVSAYRSPATNNMLRNRSRSTGVAKKSQHMLGKAMDFYVPGVKLSTLRTLAMQMQAVVSDIIRHRDRRSCISTSATSGLGPACLGKNLLEYSRTGRRCIFQPMAGRYRDITRRLPTIGSAPAPPPSRSPAPLEKTMTQERRAATR
ncbi:hypothetical protein AJ87_37895 [Rhizobium yanglingense]|nr:hypothetical protein AJ87_37895 [Rhizobium yanglingense]